MDKDLHQSDPRRERPGEQEFRGLYDDELKSHKRGIRFTHAVCGSLILVGLILKNIPLLLVLLTIAALGMLMPYHPFDCLYNGIVRHIVKRPGLVPCANQ